MAYSDQSFGLGRHAKSLLIDTAGAARTVLCIGDSTMQEDCTANGDTSNGLLYGLVVGGNFPVIGCSIRTFNGPHAELGSAVLTGYGAHTERSAGATTIGPDALYDGATTARPPLGVEDFRFSANVDNFNSYVKFLMNSVALGKISTGDFTLGNTITGRVIYRSTTNCLANGFIVGMRTATEVASTLLDMSAAAVANSNNPTLAQAEVNCGSVAGTPAVWMYPRRTGPDDFDETGKDAQFVGRVFFYRPNTPGIIFTDIANGGWVNTDHSGLVHCTDAALQLYLSLMPGGGPDYLWVMMGQNLSAGAATELNADNGTTWKSETLALVNRFRNLCIANGKAIKRTLLISPGQTAYTATNRQRLAISNKELAQGDPNIDACDLYNLLSKDVSYTRGADLVHLTELGAVNMGSLIGSALNGAAGATTPAGGGTGSVAVSNRSARASRTL